jgi:hypothetical protein
MANKRMFNSAIVESDAFLDMPLSTQALYFHLCMKADDDGFVNPKTVMKVLGSTHDELKVLIGKRFVLTFDTGVVVIKHWVIHNLIRADLYQESLYQDERKSIGMKDNGAYTEMRDGVAPLRTPEPPKWLKLRRGEPLFPRTADVPRAVRRLDKIRLDKISNNTLTSFTLFWQSYPKKVSKVSAERAWKKLTPSPELIETILKDVTTRSASEAWSKDDRKFCPHPATYLNQKRWEDEQEAQPEALRFINLDAKA